VVRTRVGYAGGTKANPTYYRLGDHSETIQIDYDPAVISYEQLLDLFWSWHRPDRPAHSTQYASRVFYHSETQRALAEASKAGHDERLGL
jgi:peptide methionine sulfoxide reductase MsrA